MGGLVHNENGAKASSAKAGLSAFMWVGSLRLRANSFMACLGSGTGKSASSGTRVLQI